MIASQRRLVGYSAPHMKVVLPEGQISELARH